MQTLTMTFLVFFFKYIILFSLTPIFSANLINRKIKGVLILFLTIFSLLNYNSNIPLVHILVHAFFLGLFLRITFFIIQFSGELVANALSFSFANQISAFDNQNASLFIYFLELITFFAFLQNDGLYFLLKLFTTLPPTDFSFIHIDHIIGHFSYVCKYSFLLSFLLWGALILFQLLLTLSAKLIGPQFNLQSIMFPMLLLLGFSFIYFWLPLFTQKTIDFIFNYPLGAGS